MKKLFNNFDLSLIKTKIFQYLIKLLLVYCVKNIYNSGWIIYTNESYDAAVVFSICWVMFLCFHTYLVMCIENTDPKVLNENCSNLPKAKEELEVPIKDSDNIVDVKEAHNELPELLQKLNELMGELYEDCTFTLLLETILFVTAGLSLSAYVNAVEQERLDRIIALTEQIIRFLF